MKKTLLAMAVGATFLAPAAAMAADTKVYGKFNIGLDHQLDQSGIDFLSGTAPGSTTNMGWWKLRDNNNSSRLGFKGNEELGFADLKAIYQLEYGIDPFGNKAGTPPFSERNIFVGLTGGVGTLKFGKYDTSIKEIGANVDEFNDTPGDITLLMAGETRNSSLIQYATPKFFDALQVVATVQPGENRTKSDNSGKETGIANTIYGAVTYNSQIVDAGIAYAKNERNGLKFDDKTVYGTALTNQTIGIDILRATVQGKFAGFELGALYQTAKGINNSAPASAAATGSQAKEKSLLASAAYAIDAFKLRGQYGQTKGDATNDKRKEMAVGVDYKLSKSFVTQINLIRFKQENTTLTSTTAVPAAIPASTKTDTLNFAIIYSF